MSFKHKYTGLVLAAVLCCGLISSCNFNKKNKGEAETSPVVSPSAAVHKTEENNTAEGELLYPEKAQDISAPETTDEVRPNTSNEVNHSSASGTSSQVNAGKTWTNEPVNEPAAVQEEDSDLGEWDFN